MRDRTSCKYYSAQFTTFAGVWLHEIRAHKTEEETLAATQTEGASELDRLTIMARKEVALGEGAHVLKILSEATGLTKHQVRHRRSKPAYQELLADIRRKEGSNTLNQSGSPLVELDQYPN